MHSQDSTLRVLYPSMYEVQSESSNVLPRADSGEDPRESALRQLYPTMYQANADNFEIWFADFYEREKDRWD